MVPAAIVAGVEVVRSAGTALPTRLSVTVFAASLVGLYAVSSLYHVPNWSARTRRILSRCDLVMIKIFIAGTFTPVAIHALEGAWRTWSVAIAWAIVAIGAVIVISPLTGPRWLTAASYVAIGWLAAIPFAHVIGALDWQAVGLIALGGVLYMTGAVIYARRWPDPWPHLFGYHEVFHLFVVAGATAHYLAIWRYIIPLAA